MQARVKPGARYATIVLFSGRIFTKSEWSEIPKGFEKQAAESEWLEVQEIPAIIEAVVMPEKLPLPPTAHLVEEKVTITAVPAASAVTYTYIPKVSAPEIHTPETVEEKAVEPAKKSGKDKGGK